LDGTWKKMHSTLRERMRVCLKRNPQPSAGIVDMMDYEGIKALLDRAKGLFPRPDHLWMDAGYRGEDKGADWVEKTLGWPVEIVSKPRKPAPEDVLMAWDRERAQEGVKVDWQKLMPPQGFVVLPRRWVVERTFSWIDQNRRMSLWTTKG
jgi:transposase